MGIGSLEVSRSIAARERLLTDDIGVDLEESISVVNTVVAMIKSQRAVFRLPNMGLVKCVSCYSVKVPKEEGSDGGRENPSAWIRPQSVEFCTQIY